MDAKSVLLTIISLRVDLCACSKFGRFMHRAKMIRIGRREGFHVMGSLLVAVLLAASVHAHSQTFTTLFNFDNTHGADPDAALVQGRDGYLYGTASSGGTKGDGTVFRITPKGKMDILHNFNFKNGEYPQAVLLLSSSGNFYGTTNGGGTNPYNTYGTIFEISPTGKFESLFSFDLTDGASPTAGLIQGADGELYGTTYGPIGTVFRITATGELTSLYGLPPQFIDPFAGLVMGNDQNFYGTGYVAGTNSDGEIFQITPSGTFTVLHSFDQTDGRWPTGTPALGNDGNFYGTTLSGGANGFGTVYRIASSGTFTSLHSFAAADGEYPQGALALGSDGDFYGTTVNGGANMKGTVYKVTPGGTLTVLHNFAGTDGSSTTAGLVQHTNGTFYGATYEGGTLGYGTIFNLNVGLEPFVSFLPIPGYAGATVGLTGQGFKGTTGVFFNGLPAEFSVVSGTYLTALVPEGATTGLVTVKTPAGTLTSNRNFLIQ